MTDPMVALYGDTPPYDDRMMVTQKGEDYCVSQHLDNPPVIAFTQRCPDCPVSFTETARLAERGLKRMEEIDNRRMSIALRCDIHMATQHGKSMPLDDPRLATLDRRFREEPEPADVVVEIPEPSDSKLCKICGEEDPPHIGCLLASKLNADFNAKGMSR